jgi:MFS family permease
MTGFALGGSGLIFYTSGVFADALRNEFHWPMAALQSGSFVTGLLALVLTPTMGLLADRFGSRWVAIPSMAAFCLCFMALSLQDGRYSTFLVLWVMLAFTSAGTLSVVWSRAVAGWFSAGRGLALGITLLGTGLTSVIAPPLVAHLIGGHGWRFAYLAVGAGALCISLPILLLFLRDKPVDDSLAAKETHGATAREAIADWRFWIMGFCLLCVTITVAGIISNLVKLMTGHGFSRADAAWAASMTGVFVIFGRLTCGFLMDRLHAPVVGAAFFMGLPVACLLLSASHLTMPMAMVAASLIGFGAAAELDVIPYLVARYFGLRKLGSVLGFAMLFFTVGSATGPIIFGRTFDIFGSYRFALWGGAIVSLIGPLSLTLLGPYPEKIAARRSKSYAAASI